MNFWVKKVTYCKTSLPQVVICVNMRHLPLLLALLLGKLRDSLAIDDAPCNTHKRAHLVALKLSAKNLSNFSLTACNFCPLSPSSNPSHFWIKTGVYVINSSCRDHKLVHVACTCRHILSMRGSIYERVHLYVRYICSCVVDSASSILHVREFELKCGLIKYNSHEAIAHLKEKRSMRVLKLVYIYGRLVCG